MQRKQELIESNEVSTFPEALRDATSIKEGQPTQLPIYLPFAATTTQAEGMRRPNAANLCTPQHADSEPSYAATDVSC